MAIMARDNTVSFVTYKCYVGTAQAIGNNKMLRLGRLIYTQIEEDQRVGIRCWRVSSG
jgi:hypothetical protein